MCTILTVPDIEDAERICLTWNQHVLNERQRLKAHVHPYSFRKRPKEKLSIHPVFKDIYVPGLAKPDDVVKN